MTSPASLIASLDDALADGEWFKLRRVIGSGANALNIDVDCLARIEAVTTEQIAVGIPATDLNLVFSPTQINEAKWPGGTVAQVPPFKVDQRIPREDGTDKAIVRGQLRRVAFVKPFFFGGEPVRLEMRVTG